MIVVSDNTATNILSDKVGSGMVFSDDRDYVLCVLTTEDADTSCGLDNQAHLLVADLARIVHRRVTGIAQ